MIRDKLIPVLWLLVACAIVGGSVGVKAHADPDVLSPRVTEYINLNHDAVCSTLDDQPGAAGVETAVWVVLGFGFTDDETSRIIETSVLLWCPEHVTDLEAFMDEYPPIDRWV